jgi:regulator of sirC expression with transglutaminase-like and TPR domain
MIRSAVGKLLALCVVLAPLSVASAQSMDNLQAQNEALLQASDQASAHSALLAQPAPQRLLPHQYAEMPYTAKADFPELSIAEAILNQPDDSIDLAKVEITVERLIDPSVNQLGTLRQLDQLAEAAKARFPQGERTDPQDKMLILMSTMRDPGPWNSNRAFAYDLDDPLGASLNSKLLSQFLATRKGNCVSMPVMYTVLAQKLGLPVTLSNAPRHVFAKFRMDDGDWTNLEITSYGGQTEQHVIERNGISPTAVGNHLWSRVLTKKQSAIVIMHTLAEHYERSGQLEKGLALTQLFLREDPKDITSLVWRGDLFCKLSDQRYKKYGNFRNIPASQRPDFDALENNCVLDHDKATELGWVNETPEHKAQYLEMVNQVKSSHGG